MPALSYTVATSTTSGGNWLSATIPPVPAHFHVTVNTAGLAAGTYYGTITVVSSASAGPVQIPVTLYLWSLAPTFSAAPASLTFTVASGSASTPQTISVVSSDPLLSPSLNLQINSAAGAGLTCIASACSVTANPVFPSAFYGALQIHGPDGSLQGAAPVTVYALPTASQPPVIGSVVSAATQIAGSLSPGEIITLHGIGIGTPPGSPLGIEVLFDGRAAPVLYTSPSQVNAIVPFEVSGQTMTTIQVINQGIESAAWGVPVTASAPGIFTRNQSGQGPAAVLNQDSTVNSPTNPALGGTAIQIFATGGGQTSPPSATGTITQPPSPMLALPVAVFIGGLQAQVIYAGAAPQEVSGVVQVNAVVPQGITPSAAAPVSITIGGATSSQGATIAIQ
jgi:uncharacterized protein (TIGR03437 family)